MAPLELSNKHLEKRDIPVVVNSYYSLSNVTVLNLSDNCLCPESFRMLFHNITSSETLHTLVLSDNLLAPEGCVFLGDFVRRSPRLAVLGVENCKMGDRGLRFLNHATHKHPGLARVDLQKNKIHDGPMLDFLWSFSTCPERQTASIDDNPLDAALIFAVLLLMRLEAHVTLSPRFPKTRNEEKFSQ